jgi:hypothetical protein
MRRKHHVRPAVDGLENRARMALSTVSLFPASGTVLPAGDGVNIGVTNNNAGNLDPSVDSLEITFGSPEATGQTLASNGSSFQTTMVSSCDGSVDVDPSDSGGKGFDSLASASPNDRGGE